MTPPTDKRETGTREENDSKIEAGGCVIQNKKRLTLIKSIGGAVREMDTNTGCRLFG